MYEAYLREVSLPPEFLIKDYIPGEPDCNYEKYVLEFLNASEWFMEKTGGISFCHPASETHGECDCIAGDYGLDLKLILSNSELRRKSRPGDAGQNPATRLHAALRLFDLSGLKVLYSLDTEEECACPAVLEEVMKRDVKYFLNNLETKKHLLLFHGYEMYFEEVIPPSFPAAMDELESALNLDFREAMKYRDLKVGMETYIGCFYSEYFVIFQWQGSENGFHWIDRIRKDKSPVYRKLRIRAEEAEYFKQGRNG